MGYAWAQWTSLICTCIFALVYLFGMVGASNSKDRVKFLFLLFCLMFGFFIGYMGGLYTHIFGPIGPMIVAH